MWVVSLYYPNLKSDPQCFCAGIVFAKFTKPTSRAETILFSKNALVTLRNGYTEHTQSHLVASTAAQFRCYYLVLRLGDLRPSHLIECHVSGHFISRYTNIFQQRQLRPSLCLKSEKYKINIFFNCMNCSATTEEGESVPYNMQSLQFGSNLDGSADYIQPLWPLVVSHRQTTKHKY